MNELIKINNQNGNLTVSSLEVAKNFDRRHDKLMSEIKRMYGELTECVQNGGDPLFIESTYVHPQNRQVYKCYDITRDGFSLLVMGFTGKKALEWKLKYIEAFNNFEKISKQQVDEIEKIKLQIEADKARAIMLDAETRNLEMKTKTIANNETKESKNLYDVHAKSKDSKYDTYTAANIADEMHISPNLVGRIANKIGIKTSEYGELVSKRMGKDKTFNMFIYNQKGHDLLVQTITELKESE